MQHFPFCFFFFFLIRPIVLSRYTREPFCRLDLSSAAHAMLSYGLSFGGDVRSGILPPSDRDMVSAHAEPRGIAVLGPVYCK